MALDFWNNALVVSAFRVKNRRGELFASLTVYVAFLGCGCVAIWYFAPYFLGRPLSESARLHLMLVLLLALQTALAAFVALGISSTSMTQEIANGTLDYQRLTSLTPLQILLGKVLGPPASIYMLTMASIPFAFVIWMLGVPELSLTTLLLMYVNIGTTAFLGASIGFLKNFRKAKQEDSGFAVLFVAMFLVPGAAVALGASPLGPLVFGNRQTAALIGPFMPVAPLVGLLLFHDPWRFHLTVYGFEVPFLLVTPLTQAILATVCFVIMIRRLTNTMTPPISKPLAYALLCLIDVLAAAVLFEPVPGSPNLPLSTTYYCLCHSVIAFLLMTFVTPDRELLLSWIWRFRGRYSSWRDLWLEDRSENFLVLVTFCIIGVAVYVLLLALPTVLVHGWETAQPTQEAVIMPLVLVCLLTISIGTLYQSCVFVGPAGGLCISLPIIFELVALLAGRRYRLDWLLSCSVITQVMNWNSPNPLPLSMAPLLLLYVLVFLFSILALRRGIRRETERVQRKLRELGVAPTLGDAVRA